MMRFKVLKLKNFLSFESLEHTFKDSPVLIQGRNLTEIDSKETNGAGKSTMEAAIAYALMATPMRRQVLDRDLIRWGEQEAEITLEIYCSVRKQTLTIYRRLSAKGSAKLELYLSSFGESVKSPVQFSTINDGNRYIFDWIGISAEDLKSFYILNKENYRSFLSSSNTDKLSLINRFIKADGLDSIGDVLDERKRPLEDSCRQAEQEVYTIQGEIQALQRELDTERERDIEQERAAKIEKIEAQIDDTIRQYDERKLIKEANAERLRAAQERYAEVKAQVKEAQRAWDERVVQDFGERREKLNAELDELNEVLSVRRQDMREAEAKVQEASKSLSRFNTILAGAVTCPSCGFEFKPGADISVKEAKMGVLQSKKIMAAAEEEAGEIRKTMTAADVEVGKIQGVLDALHTEETTARREEMNLHNALININRTLAEVDNNMSRLQFTVENDDKTLEQLDAHVIDLADQLKKAENEQIVTRAADLESSIALATKRLAKAQKRLDEARAKVIGMEQWGQRFKDFKMSLACEQLKVIQDSANMFLERQKSELRVSVDGFKRNAKGQIKSEITVLVINGEGEYKSFWSYSGGERTRIEMAFIQALQALINSTNPYGGLNFLMVDEVLEGTDPLGLALLFDALKGVDYPVYIISHIMNIRADIPTLTVVKENGYSYIEE